MEMMRKVSRTWIAKGFLLLFVISFSIWGISSNDIFHSSGSSTVISVGHQKISANFFRNVWKQELALVSQQLGFQITPEQAQAFGIERKISENLIGGAAIDQFAEDLNMGVSRDYLAKNIAQQAMFKGADGKFDEKIFAARLLNAGISESEYITINKQMILRSEMFNLLLGGVKAPKALFDELLRYYNEMRSIEYIVLTKNNIDPISPPKDEIVKKWFETVRGNYRSPEYRKIVYLFLDVNEKAKTFSLTDDELRAEYEKRKEEYRIPGNRTLEQLLFPNKKVAMSALKSIKDGRKTFDDLIRESGKKPADILLGTFTKEQVPNQFLVDPVFAVTEEGGTTDVINGPFGSVIVRVTHINKDRIKAFEEIKEELSQSIRLIKARQSIAETYTKYNKLLSEGKSLEEIAKSNNLHIEELSPVDASGLDIHGQKIYKNIPYFQDLVSRAFEVQKGVESDPLSFPDGSYMWFEVKDIVPDRDRGFEEVRSKVINDWIHEKEQESLSERARSLVDEVKKGRNFSDIAANFHLEIKNKVGIMREQEDNFLGHEGEVAVFSGPLGITGNFLTKGNSEQVIFRVIKSEVVTSKKPSFSMELLEENLRQNLLEEIVASLKNKYKIYFNYQLMKKWMQ
ncbi:peptidylprolyl isomerase [Liberibacter crescens]|nr:peptidylprolyl isomerase [Liberibacter crescens]